MTEKRFKYHMGLICEKKDGEYNLLTIQEITDLLNALHNENEQLKSACAKYDINPKNLERVLDDFDSMLDWEYSGNLNDDGEYK